MIANIITIIRIIISIVLLIFNFDLWPLVILFTIGGVSDILDGFIARSLKQESEVGSKLDSVADIFFSFVIIKLMIKYFEYVLDYKLLTINELLVIVIVVFIIFIVKTIIMIINMKKKRLIISHSLKNKLTGLLIFFFSYIFIFKCLNKLLIFVLFSIISIVSILALIDDLKVMKKN